MEEQRYVITDVDSFELRDIFECGQCFRWNAKDDGSYTGVIKNGVINVKKIKKSITNYFINVANCQANLRLWTCFKDNKNQLKGGRACLKNWISCNCRASNEYSNKRCLIYPINRYLNPYYEIFFIKRGINIDQDRYALSEMIQWIFRSAIRKGKPIDIYIPSQRMRELFKKWLGGEIQ